jgi:TolB-like protein/cytochrome c-type biogenesis protein CcmH/NrfG
MTFLEELKRRRVVRVGITYAIASWVVLQVADLATESFGAPEWVMQVLFLFAGLGLLVAIALAWAFQWTDQGLQRDSSEKPVASVGKPGKWSLVLYAILLVAVGFLLFDRFAGPGRNDGPVVREPPPQAAPSVAVLPFVNMSSNQENEYFSDGLTETLLHMLAQVPELKVAARTSSFAFKGRRADIREIADKLGVANVLEGSVQRSGNQVRITAQLIQASDGYHLWSQTFDRDLDNIFTVQDEIAEQVARALTGSLLENQSEAVRLDGGTANTEAYDLYLRGREAYHANTARKADEAERLMRRAITLDPDFALAWAGLADALDRYATLGGLAWVDYRDEYRAAAEKAFELAPDNAQVLSALGQMYRDVREMDSAQLALEKAVNIDPSNATAWSRLADVYFSLGQFQKAADAATRAMNIDPLDFELKGASTYKFTQLGQVDKAEMLAMAILENDPDATSGFSALGNIYWRTGRYAEAYRIYHRMLQVNPDSLYIMDRISDSFIELGDRETARKIIDTIESSNAQWGQARAWLCYIEGQMECVRSLVKQRLANATSEAEQVRARSLLAMYEKNWTEALDFFAQAEVFIDQRGDLLALAWNRQWAALAADRAGDEAKRDELLELSMAYWNDGQAQGGDSQYLYSFRAAGYALAGRKDAALNDLHMAIERGYRDEPSIVHDGFYDDLLDDPDMQQLLSELRASNTDELARLNAVVEELGPIW